MIDWRRWDKQSLENQIRHSWPFRRWLIWNWLTDALPSLLWLNAKTIWRGNWEEMVVGCGGALDMWRESFCKSFGKPQPDKPTK